jgi:hypothetical protein
MNIVRFTSALVLVLVLAATACSEDDDSTPTTGTASNQPAAGSGGSAGGANAGTAGNAGASTTSNGGSSAEAPDDDIDLQPGDDDNAGSGNGAPSTTDGGAPDDAGAPGDTGAPGDAGAPAPAPGDAGDAADTSTSFFVTSVGGPDGGNFGGIDGADALCQSLAAAVSPALGAKTWRAYLSTTTENARDRIGDGPWFNAAGVLVATDVDQLTDQGPGGSLDQTWAPGDATIALDELGNPVPAGGAGGVQHDILTGTLADGTLAPNLTCGDWTLATGNVQVGHSNRAGFGDDPASWSSAHANVGCAPLTAPAPNVGSGGGRGSVYCFAAN